MKARAKCQPPAPPADITFENHGSVVLIRGNTDDGKAWIEENLPRESWQIFADAIACEPRYVEDIHEGAVESGLLVAHSMKGSV